MDGGSSSAGDESALNDGLGRGRCRTNTEARERPQLSIFEPRSRRELNHVWTIECSHLVEDIVEVLSDFMLLDKVRDNDAREGTLAVGTKDQ